MLHRILFSSIPADSLWRDAGFLRLFLASTLSALGTAVSMMALPLTAVSLLHASATEMGILAACELLPFITIGLPAGVWIDRASKKRLAVLFNFIAAAGLTLVPIGFETGFLSMGVLYVVGFIVSSTEAIGGSATQVLVTLLVGRERLVVANSKLSAASSVAQVCGPALAALLIAAVGAPLAVSVDAVSFVIAGLLIGSIRLREVIVSHAGASVLAQIREGLLLVWRTPMLRGLVGVVAVWILLSDSFKALYVLHAARNLHLSEAAIGLINTLGALGGLAGAPLAHFMELRFGIRNALVAGVALAAAGYLLYVLPQPDWYFVALAAGLALFVFSAGSTLYVVNYLSLRLAVTPDGMLGRMVTSMRFATILPGPLGTIAIGHAADRFGLTPAFVGMGLACLLMSACAARWLPRQTARAGC
ncbi:MFS transporter [Uliginosibacterium sp. 31-16]|uniref:MFS transporter n=1 Tax=Uliginosibacterium sp. 31-16 TaxID=3068315 RepID=UPI00273EC70A|nr:MFS transporter [Uliginosibacterium sp. 31-16]MDP5238075.1 MFS transporter [Uliginosibacterium sp. 31-16]